jgi:tetratricopeptide (TPR) repeat protein
MKRISLLLLSLLFVLNSKLSFSKEMPEDMDRHIKQGIEDIHALQFDSADKEFNALLEKYPGQPYGYYGQAMSAWARLEYKFEQSKPELQDEFEKLTDTAIKKGKEWLDKHPNDPHAYLCVGGMYGLRSRLAVKKHQWIRAYFSGKKGIKYMKKAIKLKPDLYDAYLGPAIYEYYAGTLSGVIKLLSVFFVHGDPDKGIKMLHMVSEKGRYTSTAAKLLLIEIYTQHKDKYANPPEALKFARELRAKMPWHPLLHFVEIVALYENGNYEQVKQSAREYMKRIDEEQPYYKKVYLPRATMALATGFFAEKNWDEALKYFLQAAYALNDIKKKKVSDNRWAVWAMVRAGQVYDITGKRDKAIESYKKAMQVKDQWGLEEYIKDYLSKPYDMEKEFPGQLPPP